MKKNASILIAEDDEDDRYLVKSALEDCKINCTIHFVENGTEAMDFLYNQGKFSDKNVFQVPTLVLLDLNMPKKDGRDVLKEMKNDPQLRIIPTIILTTSKSNDDIENCYNLGANCYIVKPSSFEELSDTLETLTKFWLEVATIPR